MTVSVSASEEEIFFTPVSFDNIFSCRLSIIQLSTWNEVFILDVIAMTDNVKDAEMQQFAESFFANPRVLKLGKELSLSVLG